MLRHLVFAVAVLAQFVILAVAPAEKIMIRAEGRVVTLRTRPVDPYDVLRGYYMTLSYEVSEPPGFSAKDEERGARKYTVIAAGEDGVWSAVSCGYEPPAELAEGQALLKGRVTLSRRDGPIVYGIEKYFVPEETRREIEDAIRGQQQRIRVDVAVDSDGDAAVLRLHVGDKVYEY